MRHRHHTAHPDHTRPDLPITPMLDMSFQLLAFFIITFKPTTTEGQLALMLPKAGADTPAMNAAEQPLDSETREDLYVVRVQAKKDGAITGFELVVPKAAEPIKYATLTDKPPPNDRTLIEELAWRVEEKKRNKEPTPKLEYQFADSLNYEYVMKLLDDATNQAKFEKVVPNLLVPERPKK